MLIRKEKPVELDFLIDNLQKALYSNLKKAWNITDEKGYNCYPRCYKNYDDETKGYIAEMYVGKNEYEELYTNDVNGVVATSFFSVGESETISSAEGMMCANVSLLFFVDLKGIKPGNDRNDQEARIDVFKILDRQGVVMGIIMKSQSTGLDKVLIDYPAKRKDDLRIRADQHPNHCFRFDFQYYYQPSVINCSK